MKKGLIMLLAAAVATMAAARPVDSAAARRVAERWMQAQGVRVALADVTAETPFTAFYVFVAPEGGFVLVSADDCVVPVLAYSATERFDAKELPAHVRWWLEGYESEIGRLVAAEAAPWRSAEGTWSMEPGELTAVSPMLTTTWNQSPYYNDLCPYDSAGGSRSVAGCVATATAQVMKYWNHPATGYGSHAYTSDRTVSGVNYNFPNLTADFGSTTYQWSSMPASLSGSSSSTQVNAVATLIYHIGVADEMSYGPSASGAKNYNYRGTLQPSSQTSLMQYFKYRPDMAPLARADYSDTAFSALLRAEIDQQRPVLYSGSNVSAGHSFVLDGYDANGYFHINWGWGGYHDGYFAMGSLNPGVGGIGGNSSGTYNMANVALTGIRPNNNWSTDGMTTVTATAGTGGSVIGGGSYAFGETVSLQATANSGYRFSGWSDGSKFNPREMVATGGNYDFTALFEPVAGDTLHYCPGGHRITSYGFASGGNNYWGIHLPASVLSAGSSLQSVMLYVVEPGSYDLTVYTGVSHSTVAATDTVTFGDADVEQWHTVMLDTAVAVTSDLWIIFHFSGSGYPQAGTYYSGASGSFIAGSGLSDYGASRGLSAMVKAIFATGSVPPTPQYTLTVTSGNAAWGSVNGGGTFNEGTSVVLTAVAAEGYRFVQWQDGVVENPRTVTVTGDATYTATFEALPPTMFTLRLASADAAMGTVEGAGSYEAGTEVTIRAIPADGYHFTLWSDGNTDNPRTVTMTTDLSYMAYFAANVGIGEVEGAGVRVSLDWRTLRIEGAEADFYDMLGRRLGTGSEVTFEAAGVYLLRMGSKVYKIVIK